MNKEVLIEKPSMGSRFLSYFLDIVVTMLSSVILYFAVLYGVFGLGLNYISNNNLISETREEYNLNIPYDTDYKPYEKVIKEIYFDDFAKEIQHDFNKDGSNYSIEYIYNVLVLNLPEEPNANTYSNGLFKYKQNEDGSFNLNEIGVIENGSGEYFERNLADLFYGTYTDLPNLIRKYDESFDNALYENGLYEMISRVTSLAISVIVFYVVIPLLDKNGSTIFENKFKIGYVNNRNYLQIKKWKVPLRALIYFILPLIGMIFYNNYTLVILIIFPIFLNPAAILLNKRNADFYELICSAKACDLVASEIFKTEDELKNFEKQQEVSDTNYLENLKNADSLKIKNKGDNQNV